MLQIMVLGFLSIIDDFTRSCWLYPLKRQDQCVTIMNNFLSYKENQFNIHVKYVRTDNAMELCDGSMLQLFIAKGINYQRDCVQNPQQIGVVECNYKNLIETTRALFLV